MNFDSKIYNNILSVPMSIVVFMTDRRFNKQYHNQMLIIVPNHQQCHLINSSWCVVVLTPMYTVHSVQFEMIAEYYMIHNQFNTIHPCDTNRSCCPRGYLVIIVRYGQIAKSIVIVQAIALDACSHIKMAVAN